jgi:uncharacterized damage-inducible protein DinB
MKMKKWFKRKFNQELDPGTFPGIIERLAGTPARIEEKIGDINPEFYTLKPEAKWSIQENAGHLADLEPLWSGRLDDFTSSKKILREADLTNKKTETAEHNLKPMDGILAEFRSLRGQLTNKLIQLKDEDLERTSLHPRLQTPMKIIDLMYFIAEHDDHHLAQISFLDDELKNSSQKSK